MRTTNISLVGVVKHDEHAAEMLSWAEVLTLSSDLEVTVSFGAVKTAVFLDTCTI